MLRKSCRGCGCTSTMREYRRRLSGFFGKQMQINEARKWHPECGIMRPSPRTAHTTCNNPLPPGKKYVAVVLLTSETLYFVVDVRSKGEELFNQVCNFLGMNDVEMFGLALFVEGEYHFIDPSLKLSKYACKAWKAQQGTGVDSSGKPFLTLHLRVQLYVDCHLLISDKVARHHYYLQLKENVINYCQAIGEERAFLLAAYALQSDIGNYNPEKHQGNYFNPYKYFPAWIIQHVGANYITQHAPSMHRDNYGLSKGEAQVGYIKEASDSTAPHNMHFYKLKRKKSKTHSTIWLGICPKGIEIYEENGCVTKSHLSTFPWPDIAKLYFEKKKFEIRSVGCPESRKFTYFANNEETTKSLLWLCRITHQFHMAVQPRLQELKKLELEGHKHYRESYIYSDSFDLALEQGRSDIGDGTSTLPSVSSSLKKSGTSSSNSDQRVSVISNASSNTTSGIVSDKVQSFDESEDEPDEEIMINSPPAPSLESLPSSEDLGFPMSPEDRIACNAADKSNKQTTIGDGSHHVFPSGWNSVDQRSASWTPTSSVVSGSSYTSYTDSTYSSSSQLSAATVKTGTLPQKVHPPAYSTSGSAAVVRGSREAKPQSAGRSAASTPKIVSCGGASTNCRGQCAKSVSDANAAHCKVSVVESVSASQDKCPSRINRIHKLCVQTLKCSEIPSHVSESSNSSSNSVENERSKQVHVIATQPVAHHAQTNCLPLSPSSNGPSFVPPTHLTEAINPVFQAIPPTTTSKTPTSHGRTATRIGVSSLTRVQRQPLALYNSTNVGTPCGMGIAVAASEPNLCNPKMWASPLVPSSSPYNYFSLPPNDTSSNPSTLPMSHHHHSHHHPVVCSDGPLVSRVGASPAVYNNSMLKEQSVVQYHSTNDLTVLPPEPTVDADSSFRSMTEFPCIPPPPEYSGSLPLTPVQQLVNGNSSSNGNGIATGGEHLLHNGTGLNASENCANNSAAAIVSTTVCSQDNPEPKLQSNGTLAVNGDDHELTQPLTNGTGPSPPVKGDLLDLQQLREKSRDLDLPLISALCNDRSLLMLPKTVPTCSRQRHLGSCRDVRRFSCSYVPSVAINEGMAAMGARTAASTENIPTCPQHRPISWHLECLDYGWLTSAVAQQQQQKSQVSQKMKEKTVTIPPVQSYMPVVLPPTILTSFSGKTPEKCHSAPMDSSDSSAGMRQNAIASATKQMLPMKLSSNISSTPNGRHVAKDQSS